MRYDVGYEFMDPFKIAAQEAAAATASNLERHGFKELEWTRGESAYVVQTPWGDCLGLVVEGLGTKNLVADATHFQLQIAKRLELALGADIFANVGWCNVASSVNDLATLGIRPLVYGQHLAVGDSKKFFKNERRRDGYIKGTVDACMKAGCSWGCGETPSLKDIILPTAAELSGAAFGVCKPGQLIRCQIQEGDRIVILPSTGLHINGYTLARDIAGSLAQGYLTPMSDGKPFGLGLLEKTILYGPIIETCQELGAEIHYAINITGHGWRKLMRAREPFVYVIDAVPVPQPVFDLIQEHGKVDVRDMYADYNMGAGFVLIVPQKSMDAVKQGCLQHGIMPLLNVGHVEKQSDVKMVDIRPVVITFDARELGVR